MIRETRSPYWPLVPPQVCSSRRTVLHTTAGGGGGWDVVSSNLPVVSVNGVTADPASNTVYVATDGGLFFGSMSLNTLGATPAWTLIPGLPAARVMDVRLDSGETRIWTTLEGPGLYTGMAPHRLADPRVVSSADLVARAAAPGGLLSVAGARVESATAGGLQVAVLDANDSESQLQIPYNAAGPNLSLAINGPQGSREFAAIALQPTSPAIFEVDGAPLLEDADLQVMLDGMHPGHSHMRIRIMAAGLGRVRPDWPAGVPAPLEDMPQVVAPVTAYLDREPVDVVRAVLAPDTRAFIGWKSSFPRFCNTVWPSSIFRSTVRKAIMSGFTQSPVYIEGYIE